MTTDEINEFLEELHKMSEKGEMPDPVDDEEDYLEIVEQMRQFMMGMPKYKDASREEIIEHASLLGAFGKLFLRLEDAYLKLSEIGAEGKMEPEEIIREHAFDIGIAIFQYVSKAIVHAQVTTVTTGLVNLSVTPATSTGTGVGAGKGKLG